MAGTPYAFLTVALLAIMTSGLMRGGHGYQRTAAAAAISRPKKAGTSTGGTSHSRKSNLMEFDI
jgi:hypothetical protein